MVKKPSVRPIWRQCCKCEYRYCLLLTEVCPWCKSDWRFSLDVGEPFGDLVDRISSGDLQKQFTRRLIVRKRLKIQKKRRAWWKKE